jgi:hypothetical protein
MKIWKSATKSLKECQPTRKQFAFAMAKQFDKLSKSNKTEVDALRFRIRLNDQVWVDLEETYTTYVAAEPWERLPIRQRFIRKWKGCITSHEREPAVSNITYKIAVRGNGQVDIVRN